MIKSPLFPVLLVLFIIGMADPVTGDQPGSPDLPASRQSLYAGRNILSCSPDMAYVPFGFLNTPITLKEGIGTLSFPITVANEKAQVFFNQGMAFLYSFEYVQAARSLYTAFREDSSSAMVSWGLAQVYASMDDTTESRNFSARAVSLSGNASPEEKMLIALLETRVAPAYDSTSNAQLRIRSQALSDSANRLFPRSAEIWAMTGKMRAFHNTGPANESNVSALRHAIDDYMMKVLEINPAHFGIWHWLIHFNEGTTEFSKALGYGRLYTTAAPQIAHAWHMYAHDLMKTGRVTEAIEKFNHAFEIEKQKYKVENMPERYDWHHAHNMELLAYCYQYKGQFEKAEKIFSVLDTLTPSMDSREAQVRKGHPYYYLQINQPLKAMELSRPLIAAKYYMSRFTGYFIRGLSEVFAGDTIAAATSYASMLHIVDSLKNASIRGGTTSDVAADDFGYMYAHAGIVQMGAQLIGTPYSPQVAVKMNNIQNTLLKQTGPDPWIDALYFLQLLTQMSINSGNLVLAESSAKNMMLHDPGYPGSYLMMARIKKAGGQLAESKTWMAKAKEGYRESDPAFLKTLK